MNTRNHNNIHRFALVLAALLLSGTTQTNAQTLPHVDFPSADHPRVEVAFVLDTTGSMSGLIEGAKAKIWDIANLLISAEPTPDIRFGLVGYRDRGDAYITQLFDLSDDIDAIYGHLRGFVAGGGGDGPESVNQALNEAITQMSWSDGEDVLRIVFLVGDAPPHMDYAQDVPYAQSVAQALERGIVVNTIQCGDWAETTTIWQEIAQLGEGEYAAIGQSGDVMVIATPFDEELARLNRELGTTVIGYGDAEDIARMGAYQEAAEAAAPAAAADRLGYTSATGTIMGGGGDLIDAIARGDVSLASLDDDELPENMRGMSEGERRDYVTQQTAHRSELQTQVDQLLEQRRSFIDAERERLRAEGGLTGFDAEVDRMIREQGARIGVDFM